jgi:hypothetical protein
MPLAAFSLQQASSSLGRAEACVKRATRALEQLEEAGQGDPKLRHDLRGLLGTLVAGMQLLDGVAPDSDLAADAREVVERQVLRIDQLLATASWDPQ